MLHPSNILLGLAALMAAAGYFLPRAGQGQRELVLISILDLVVLVFVVLAVVFW